MANAAWAGVWVSFFALLGLSLTVYFACLAWLAAERSAKADEEALETTKTQLKESREAAITERERVEAEAEVQKDRFDRQIAEAKRSADAARDSADNASFIGRNQSRAYVHVSEARIDYTETKTLLSTNDFLPALYLKLENVGATPTKSVRYDIVVGVENFDTIWAGYRALHHVYFSDTLNIAPKATSEIRAFAQHLIEILEDEAKWLRSPNALNSKSLTIRGRLIYKDVFDKEHHTDFGFSCRRPAPKDIVPMDPMTRGGFLRYESYPPKEK
jgi:hypothetical protein